jgi:hypothetical protein
VNQTPLEVYPAIPSLLAMVSKPGSHRPVAKSHRPFLSFSTLRKTPKIDNQTLIVHLLINT